MVTSCIFKNTSVSDCFQSNLLRPHLDCQISSKYTEIGAKKARPPSRIKNERSISRTTSRHRQNVFIITNRLSFRSKNLGTRKCLSYISYTLPLERELLAIVYRETTPALLGVGEGSYEVEDWCVDLSSPIEHLSHDP